MNNLSEEQKMMRERIKARRPKYHSVEKMLSRTDLKCIHCNNPTTANKRDGSINPCKDCHTLKMRIAKYGMSLGQYFRMYKDQDGKCAICDEHQPRLVVDHCHTLSHPRGLLCRSCNLGLGMFKDNKQKLANAIKYLSFNDIHDDWNVQGELLSTRKKKQIILNEYVVVM